MWFNGLKKDFFFKFKGVIFLKYPVYSLNYVTMSRQEVRSINFNVLNPIFLLFIIQNDTVKIWNDKKKETKDH